jgi:hypothetical protein
MNSAQSLPFSPYHSKMVLLNGPPLSNFVDRGLGEWEWLGPESTKNITLCNTPKNLLTLVLAPSLFPHSLNFVDRGLGAPKLSLCVTRPKTYLLWFWFPPFFLIRSTLWTGAWEYQKYLFV